MELSERENAFPHVEFPETKLGRDLETIAGMIFGNANTACYYVDQSGYDTHARQFDIVGGEPKPLEGRHARRRVHGDSKGFHKWDPVIVRGKGRQNLSDLIFRYAEPVPKNCVVNSSEIQISGHAMVHDTVFQRQ